MTSKILNALGLITMFAVILVMIPLTVPKLFGLRIYGVQTSSMTPLYYVGGVIYVKDADASEVRVGDVITYNLDEGLELVETHRVMEITEDAYLTKGDNNNSYDPEPVRKDRLVGKPIYYIPLLGLVAELIATFKGKLIMVIIFSLCLCLWLTADLIKKTQSVKKTNKDSDKNSEKSSGKGSEKGLEKRSEEGSGENDIEAMNCEDGATVEPQVAGSGRSGIFMQAAGIVLVLCAVVYLGYIGYGYISADKAYSTLESDIMSGVTVSRLSEVSMVPTAAGAEAESSSEASTGASTEASSEESADKLGGVGVLATALTVVEASADQRTIMENLKALQDKYSVIIGWIFIDGTDISYPIVHSDNNDNYLRRTYEGVSKTAGSIFMESVNTPDFNDSHTIIYGHNMRDGSMFGGLKEYKLDADFYEGHKFITIYTAESVRTYEIYAYSDVDITSPVYQVEFLGQEDFTKVINETKRRSYRATELADTVWAGDKVLTLSTCSTTGKRFIVNAKLVQVGE